MKKTGSEQHSPAEPLERARLHRRAADAGLFFLSNASRHITGEVMLVDAGLHLMSAASS